MIIDDRLTLRERDIIHGLLRAKSIKEIANDLQLSPNTVKDYTKTIYMKLNVHSATELMRRELAKPPGSITLGDYLGLADEIYRGRRRCVTDLLRSVVARAVGSTDITFWGIGMRPTGRVLVSAESGEDGASGAFIADALQRGWAVASDEQIAFHCPVAAPTPFMMVRLPPGAKLKLNDVVAVRVLVRLASESQGPALAAGG